MDQPNQKEKNCCPKFNPQPWDEKEIIWNDKLFVKASYKSFMHIPLNFAKVIRKNIKKIQAGQAEVENPIVLVDERSSWGADMYISVSRPVADAETVKISGVFMSKVFEGSYKNMKKWINEMKQLVTAQKKEIKKMYFYYPTCPGCSKKYKENYVVILAQV